jgi:hypothetical protein
VGICMRCQNQYLIFGILSVGMVLIPILMPPISQSVDYHQFADQRTYFGTPNFFNVVSNIFIFFSGLVGLILLIRPREFLLHITFIKFSERWPYFILFLSVIMASLASTYYHLAPDNARLVWDRFPIAIGVVTLLSTVLIERINTNIGFISLPCLILFGVGSVVYWNWSEQFGLGNLNYYIVVQLYSILAIILLSKYFSSRYTGGAAIYVVIILYAFAKLAETLDHEIYSLGQVISGHSVKHLFVGLAVFQIVHMLQNRRPLLK